MQSWVLVMCLVIMFRRVSPKCDDSTNGSVEEGNLGQSDMFSWLGILRVHVHNDGNDKPQNQIAATGVVLIRLRWAIVNADEVSHVSPTLLKEDSRVMFIGSRNTPWFCRPKSYRTHHEYEYKTMHTVGLLELNLDDVNEFPMRPICFTDQMSFNTSTFLYTIGYTDENMALEKVIYKVQYTDKKSCDEFYYRSGQMDPKSKPVRYLCGYATSKQSQCTWDSGMVLVTNVSGIFYLIGLSIHGPGCAAPARFIDLQPYYNWIDTSSTLDRELYDDYLV